MIEDGVIPAAVLQYQEDESHGAFVRGDSVFLRNWPYVYALLSNPEESRDQAGPGRRRLAPRERREPELQRPRRLELLHQRRLGEAGPGLGVHPVDDGAGAAQEERARRVEAARPARASTRTRRSWTTSPSPGSARTSSSRTPARGPSRPSTRTSPWRWRRSSTPPSPARCPPKRPSRPSRGSCSEPRQAGRGGRKVAVRRRAAAVSPYREAGSAAGGRPLAALSGRVPGGPGESRRRRGGRRAAGRRRPRRRGRPAGRRR